MVLETTIKKKKKLKWNGDQKEEEGIKGKKVVKIGK